MVDLLVEVAKENQGCLFVMGTEASGKWVREIKGSGPVEAMLLENHPHFKNVPKTRKYVLHEFYREDLDGTPVGEPGQYEIKGA